MAFTVEDGTGVTGANSYLSVADADTYWADRANASSPDGTAWSGASTADKEGALVEASQYLDANFQWVWNNPPRWQGWINPLGPLEAYTPLKSDGQGLQWPRRAAYDEETYVLQDGVPQKVKDATAELAIYALDGRLMSSRDRGGMIKREQVGNLEVEYMDNAPGGTSFPYIDRLLTGLYWQKSGRTKLRRA
jgi:hypothetical protein